MSAAALAALSACTSSQNRVSHVGGAPAPQTGAGSSTSPAPVPVAAITASPNDTTRINPTTPVSVSVTHGTLTGLTMKNSIGTHVTGTFSADHRSWHTTEVLGYGRTYTIKADAKNPAGRTTAKTEKLTTLEPHATTTATIDRMGGYLLEGHQTYGVALIPVVHFSSPVHNRAAAQRSLKVISSKHVDGVWSWIDNHDVAYRPQGYFPANTKIKVKANVYGVDLGKGEYGESDESTSYTIGRKQTTVADDNAPEAVDKVRVYNAAGKVLRTMDTSMGQHTGVTVDGNYINFYTLNGTYTVLEHDNPAIMSSQSYGLPVADGGYKAFPVPYSTKISVDGIYLHEYNSTAYQQENGIDASEGCLNLVTDDAVWFYDHSLVGDPVVVHGKKAAPEIQPWQGGYWSIPWSKWQAGSAL